MILELVSIRVLPDGFRIDECKENRMKVLALETAANVQELGLYVNSCCREELIYDEGDTFLDCPRCRQQCEWEFEARITRDFDAFPV